jgi:hypothetical protein
MGKAQLTRGPFQQARHPAEGSHRFHDRLSLRWRYPAVLDITCHGVSIVQLANYLPPGHPAGLRAGDEHDAFAWGGGGVPGGLDIAEQHGAGVDGEAAAAQFVE